MDRCHCFGQRSKSVEASVGHDYNLDPKGEEETKMMMMMMISFSIDIDLQQVKNMLNNLLLTSVDENAS